MTARWRCGNRGCSHPYDRAWHGRMADRIRAEAGPRTEDDFTAAHPDPWMEPCDDCGRLGGRHDPAVEH